MPEVDVGITPGWGGTTRMARLIGRRMTKEINLLGALHPASRAVELGLWNRVVDDDRLQAEVDALVQVVLSKNQQTVRQLKFINRQGRRGGPANGAGLRGALGGPDGRGQRRLAGRGRRPSERDRQLHRRRRAVEGTTRAGTQLLGELMRQLLFIEPERLEWERFPTW